METRKSIESFNLTEDESVDSDASQNTRSSVASSKRRFSTKKRRSSKVNNLAANGASKSKLNFKSSNYIKEDHKQPIFGVQFYQHIGDPDDDPLLFGTVGSNRVSIYKCGHDCGRINLYQSYADSDPEENFYSCAWTYNVTTGEPLFCFAGGKGMLHVLNACTRQFSGTFQGHGSAINELKTHPIDPNLIITASKDHTLRLWNIQTECCVIIFGGVGGHRDEVLGVDFDVFGTRIVTCGMDHSLKFWSFQTEAVKKVIADSHEYSVDKTKETFPTLAVHYPEFTTRDVHRNYVDCCVWLGELVLSKSCDNQVVCWKPKESLENIMKTKNNTDIEIFVLHKFFIEQCDIWFMRFAIDFNQTILALGNQVGKIYVYDLEVDHPSDAKMVLLNHGRCNSAIRQISLSSSAKVMVAVCDDGTIWRWDRQT